MKCNNDHHRARVLAWGLVFALAFLAAGAGVARGQSTLFPGTIYGEVLFTNTDPAVVNLLSTADPNRPGSPAVPVQGFSSGSIGANSIGFGLSASSGVQIATPLVGTYELTVQARDPNGMDGIGYQVDTTVFLDGGRDSYSFMSQITANPVVPGAMELLNFEECAAIVEVRFVDAMANPVAVTSMDIFVSNARGSAVGVSQTWLAARGDGGMHDILIRFVTGNDPASNTLVSEHRTTVPLMCDQISVVECVLPSGGPEGQLGKIQGRIDVVGETENGVTQIVADDGPLGNGRQDNQPAPHGPPTPFELENLVPSDAFGPPDPYRVWVTGFSLPNVGPRGSFFRPPFLGAGSNPGVEVTAGGCEDVGDTFVIDPCHIKGNVFLEGPPDDPQLGGSCLLDLIDGRSGVRAYGSDRIAAGARFSAAGGYASSGFDGTPQPDPQRTVLRGNFEMVVGGLDGAWLVPVPMPPPANTNSFWDPSYLDTGFFDPSIAAVPASQTYQDSYVSIYNGTIGEQLAEAGKVKSFDHRYCFGQVNWQILSADPTVKLFTPTVLFSAIPDAGSSFATCQPSVTSPTGFDCSVSGSANGVPLAAATAASTTDVVLCLPAARPIRYTFNTFATSLPPSGITSRTEVDTTQVELSCRQIVEINNRIQLVLDPLPVAVVTPSVDLTGEVRSIDPVAEIFASVNGGAPIHFCGSGTTPACPVPPVDFDFPVPLDECDNRITVTGVDSEGVRASVTDHTLLDGEAPVISGCEDIALEVLSRHGGEVSFDGITATENCETEPVITCDPESGSFFPIGTTVVTCKAEDFAGNVSSCSFDVNLTPCPRLDLHGGFHNGGSPLASVDTTVGGSSPLSPPAAVGIDGLTSLAHDEASGLLYAATGDGDDSLWRIDPATGVATRVGPFVFFDQNGARQNISNVQGMDIAPPAAAALGYEVGAIYAVSIDGVGSCNPNCLFKIDKATGVGTQLGALALNQGRGVSFNPKTGELWVIDASSKSLYVIGANGSLSFRFQVPHSNFGAQTGIDTVFSLAHNCAGEMYAIDVAYGVLLFIDEDTHQAHWVGPYGSVRSPAGSFDMQALDGGFDPGS